MDAVNPEIRNTEIDQRRLAWMRKVMPWSYIVSGLIIVATIWVSLWPYLPGMWLGSDNYIPRHLFLLPVVGLSVCATLYLTLRLKRTLLVFPLLIGAFLPCSGMVTSVDPEFRFRYEHEKYLSAITTGKSFGDQHSEDVNGRKLTYWCWAMFRGSDGAVGIVYDPQDKMTMEGEGGDARAFHDLTRGMIFRLRRIEPHWYFVKHS